MTRRLATITLTALLAVAAVAVPGKAPALSITFDLPSLTFPPATPQPTPTRPRR